MDAATELAVTGGRSTSPLGRWTIALLVVGYLALDAIAGAGGSPLAPRLPTGATPAAWCVRIARWIGLDHLSHGAMTGLAIGILAGLVVAFGLLAREAWLGRVSLRTVLVAAALSLALSMAAPLLLSRDVYSYAAYGRIFGLYGGNPYASAPAAFPTDPFVKVTSTQWLHTPSLYGPGFVLLSAGITRAWAGSLGATILAFKVIAGAAAMLATVLAAWAVRAWRPGRAAFAAAAMGLNPVIVVHTVGGGHNDALIAALLAGALFAAVRWVRRSEGMPQLRMQSSRVGADEGVPQAGAQWSAPGLRQSALSDTWSLAITILLTLVVMIKAVVVVPLVLWLWCLFRSAAKGDRAKIVLIHAGLAVGLGILLFAPLLAGWRTLRPLATLSSVQGWASPSRLIGHGVEAVVRPLAGAGVGSVAEKVIAGAVLVTFLFLWWRVTRVVRPETLPSAWGSSLLLFVLALPYLTPWYSAWFLPFLGVLADDALVWIGLALTWVLALTGVPAEPGSAPAAWRGMMLAVHYVAAPVVLGLFAVAAVRILRGQAERWPPGDRRRPWRTPASPPGPARPARSE